MLLEFKEWGAKTLGWADQGGLHGGGIKHIPIWEAPDAYQEFLIRLQSKLRV